MMLVPLFSPNESVAMSKRFFINSFAANNTEEGSMSKEHSNDTEDLMESTLGCCVTVIVGSFFSWLCVVHFLFLSPAAGKD